MDGPPDDDRLDVDAGGARAPVALLSTTTYAHLDEDLPQLVRALHERGIGTRIADWHDPEVDWSAFDLVIIRSTWDYTDDPVGFLTALERIDRATVLANPLDVVQATIDKRYLRRLHDLGVPVVPTTVLEPGDPVELPRGAPLVLKPTVSAGARDTERYAPGSSDEAEVHARRLLAAGRAVLVQPYVEAIDDHGETGVVFLGGELSHAFRKGPILRGDAAFVEGLYREEQIDPRQPSPAEVAAAEVVLDAVAELVPGRTRADLLYARVDLVPGPTGPLLMELELIEPSLFLDTSEAAPARAVAAVYEWLERAGGAAQVGSPSPSGSPSTWPS